MQTWNKGHDMYELSHVYIGQTVSILNIYFEYAMHGIIETLRHGINLTMGVWNN